MCPEKQAAKIEHKDLNIIKLKKGETVNMSKALGSKIRLAILRLTSTEELNLSEIAEKLVYESKDKDGNLFEKRGSTPQAIYHHLQILEKSKLIHVVREKKIKNMNKTIKYYRASYEPDGINILLWAPLDVIEHTYLESMTPIQEKPVERIVKKMADKVFEDLTDAKIEILTKVIKNMVDTTHDSMNSLRKEYELEIDEKLWSLILLFSNLSVMNSAKKLIEDEKFRQPLDDLFSLIVEEKQEYKI
ncbi:MAG: helix-turn-helix transcriptional regulator [Candidatus Heimdallarchaeota archaeon]|nr:helix-turn-helix transcriptional regulator [Candidatus Heimdallarchaeota archaeon]